MITLSNVDINSISGGTHKIDSQDFVETYSAAAYGIIIGIFSCLLVYSILKD